MKKEIDLMIVDDPLLDDHNQRHPVEDETDEITAELERLVALPRTPITEMKIRRLLKRAGYPATAKEFAKWKRGGHP